MISPFMLIIALLFFALGIALCKGHTNLLHEYHRSRVSEEDLPALGKHTGLGMMLIGVGIAAFGVLFDIALYTDTRLLLTVGIGALFAGLAAGIVILLCAVIHYNKGLF